MDCSIIIVSYNTFDITKEAVRTAALSASALDYEIVVVDNASPDNSGPRLKKEFEDHEHRVRVIENPENVGFAAANNIGAKNSSGRNLFFLNPDTIVHGEAVVVLSRFLDEHAEAGAIGPLILNADGSRQASNFRRLSFPTILNHHLRIPSFPTIENRLPQDIAEVEIVYGAALAITRQAYEAIGGWDETYFMYCEENEMCYALVKAGYVNYFIPTAAITHYGGASSLDRYSDQMILHNRTLLTFMKRHHSVGLRVFHRLTGFLGFAARVPAFKVLELLRPETRDSYKRRRLAAWELAKWFAFDFNGIDDR